MKTAIKVLDVNEAQTDGSNPLFHRSSHSGVNKIHLKMFTSLDYSFLLFRIQ